MSDRLSILRCRGSGAAIFEARDIILLLSFSQLFGRQFGPRVGCRSHRWNFCYGTGCTSACVIISSATSVGDGEVATPSPSEVDGGDSSVMRSGIGSSMTFSASINTRPSHLPPDLRIFKRTATRTHLKSSLHI